MEFVTFHAWLTPEESGHPNQSLAFAEQLQLIRLMMKSVRLWYPGSSMTLLTNARTAAWRLPWHCTRVVNDVAPANLMLERAVAQERYVLASHMAAPMVLLDSDMLLNGSLQTVFERTFDVALTWRPNHEMPINGGLVILNNERPHVVKDFFSRYVSVYRRKYAEQARWFGDQLALQECVGLQGEAMSDYGVVERDGCRLLLLPCTRYNFSPHNRYRDICSRLPDKAVLHFKGQRKRLMARFWRAWLHPAHSHSPWVKYVGWRERRWIARHAEEERAGSSMGLHDQAGRPA
ncbi:MAG TPA: hypothetical protein VJR03_08685 [Nitrospira sp.]|nr:hypothetical protein [Nitrospira sp.]